MLSEKTSKQNHINSLITNLEEEEGESLESMPRNIIQY